MKNKKFSLVCLLSLLVLGLVENIVPQAKAIWNTQTNSWLEDQFLEVRKYVWTYFNATDWSLHYPYALESTEETNSVYDRMGLALYTLLCFQAYQKTDNIDYIHEGQFFLEGLNSSSRKQLDKTLIYAVKSGAYGFFYADVPLMFAKQISNELGLSNYDIAGWVTAATFNSL